MPLEEVIRRMTSLPAQKIGLKDIGLIKEGALSDIVIFDFEKINDLSTYTDPHHFPIGIEQVIINGEFVIKDQALTGNKPGRWLKKK